MIAIKSKSNHYYRNIKLVRACKTEGDQVNYLLDVHWSRDSTQKNQSPIFIQSPIAAKFLTIFYFHYERTD